MKRFLPVIIFLVALGGAYYYGRLPVPNPDPNHTHADFAIWVNGQKLDFTDPKYMSEAYEEGKEVRTDPLRKYLHLHDGNGHVLHRHKPGLTFGEFLESLGVVLTKDGLNLCMETPDSSRVCEDEAAHRTWIMMVNGERKAFFDGEYVPADEDKILILLPVSDDEALQQQEISTAMKQMTDDACMYSKTCPWRGDPPTENCIADPTIPCVAH